MSRNSKLVHGFMVLVLSSCFWSGCDQAKKEKVPPDSGREPSAKASEAGEAQSNVGTGFSEMADSVMKQAASQGLQIEASNKDLLARLIRIYLVRGDLHQAFGNPEKFNLTALVQWAAGPGLSVDYDKSKLAPYANALAALASMTNGDKPVYARVE